MPIIEAIILWLHLMAAIVFVGGSFFMWLVIVPVSHQIAEDEAERTKIVSRIAKRFGLVASISLIILVVTGIYNATWYLPSLSSISGKGGAILLIKVVLVAIMIVFIYIHNVYFGRRITRLANEGKVEELWRTRRKSRVISAINLLLMTAILLLSVFLQIPI